MIIPYDERYEFIWLEDSKIKFKHPVSNYYLKLNDLSINVIISLKWSEWGYKFFEHIRKELDSLGEDFNMENILNKSMQKIEKSNEENKIIIMDDKIIKDFNDFKENLNKVYLNEEWKKIFNENTKIHLKMKMNLREYLILSNLLFPNLVKFK